MERYEIRPVPDEDGFWAGIGKSFGNLSEALWELIDNAISSIISSGKSVKIVIVSIERTSKGYLLRVEDTGPGIKDLESGLSVGNKSHQTTVYNEHGYGMKHAIAFCDLENGNWVIYTKTEDDKETYRKISAPYSTQSMHYAIIPEKDKPWPGKYSQTGTIFEIEVTPETFFTLREKWNPNAQELRCLEYLCEDLSFVYSGVISTKKINIEVRSESIKKDGKPFFKDILQLEPVKKAIYKKKKIMKDTDLGGGKLSIEIEQIEMGKHHQTNRYYQPNPRASGVEIRINGRAIAYNLFDEIWSNVNHPSTNRFLMIVNLISDNPAALPSTNRTKTGLLEKDPKTVELYTWIRTQCPNPPKKSVDEITERERFRKLCQDLNDVVGQRIEDYNAEVEFKVFTELGSNVSADMFEYDGNKVRLYEGKVGKADVQSIYQLLMYWDGAVADGLQPNEGILLADTFSAGVDNIIEMLNRKKDDNNRNYNFKTQTWDKAFPT